MREPNHNLKSVLEHLGLTNLAVAKAIGVDPSSVSRILSGQRRLPAASPQMEALADHILVQSRRVADMDWLKAQFQAAGLPTDISTVYRFKQNLIMWLATDGKKLRRNLGASLPSDIAGGAPRAPKQTAPEASSAQSDVKIGLVEIVFALRPALAALKKGEAVNIFLSNDRLTTVTNEDVSALVCRMIAENGLYVNMVVCVSGDTRAMSKLLDSYMSTLISGHVKLSVVHGMTQTVTSSMHILMQNGYAMLVTETAGAAAPPIATVIRNADFVREMQDSFAAAARYAQPILNIYNDNFSRNILEILYMEFCTPGALDIVKDSLNPLYMKPKAYDRFLRTRGHAQAEYAWRSAEFVRFKNGMDAVLKAGSPYREIISLTRLNDIALRGSCRMAGLYFMELGYIDLDAEGCAAILTGYIDYLEHEPNFNLLILDDLSILHQNNCWHIKQNQSIGINHWQGREPVMIHSDQLMLLREFQAHFDKLWEDGQKAVGNRANVISILQDVVRRLRATCDSFSAQNNGQ
ncbi:helix-turn-helix domain-containing protein [Bacillota bacterium Meth-B3]